VSTLLPDGLVTLREAADMIAQSKYAGLPDPEIVTKLRELRIDVADGTAIDDATNELWKAVDAGRLRPLAVGGRPRKVVSLRTINTREIVALRSPRGRAFTFLRPRHPLYKQFTAWFGLDLADVALAFRQREVEKLARTLLRRRRKAADAKTRRGRPSRLTVVGIAINEVLASGKWSPEKSLKALTQRVNRRRSTDRAISEDTVTRALDHLYEETGDRRFQRLARKRP
jgi:hypothetical protein